MKLVSQGKVIKLILFSLFMENKNVGYMLLGISALVIFIIFMFNSAMKKIIDTGCSMMHDTGYCPAYGTINQQTYLALGIVSLLVIVSIILIFSKPEKEIIIRRVEEKIKKKKLDTSELKSEEKAVFDLVRENKAVFQADLIEKTRFGKAKMTRIIDRLEGKGFVERKRRGMTNIVVLKE